MSDVEAEPETEVAPPEDIPNGLRFIHAVEMQTRARVAELSAKLDALVETLSSEGRLPPEAFEKRRRLAIVRENERDEREIRVEIADAPDKYALEDLPIIDCEARVHLCQARCCTLNVTLSVQDLDERVARWDYGRPYRLAQRQDGYCVHNEGGACSIYAARPAACRTYDCRCDRRIWIDFEAKIPAP